jgi:hypothetical protein
MEAGKLYKYRNNFFCKQIFSSPNYGEQPIFKLNLDEVIMFLGEINKPNIFQDFYKILCPNGLIGWIIYMPHEWESDHMNVG